MYKLVFQVGDTVAALVKLDGSLHFFVNGRDLGLAAQEVPSSVYGVVDLYGQSAQATLTCSQRNHPSTESEVSEGRRSLQPTVRSKFLNYTLIPLNLV